jgi:hypothetical protein
MCRERPGWVERSTGGHELRTAFGLRRPKAGHRVALACLACRTGPPGIQRAGRVRARWRPRCFRFHHWAMTGTTASNLKSPVRHCTFAYAGRTCASHPTTSRTRSTKLRTAVAQMPRPQRGRRALRQDRSLRRVRDDDPARGDNCTMGPADARARSPKTPFDQGCRAGKGLTPDERMPLRVLIPGCAKGRQWSAIHWIERGTPAVRHQGTSDSSATSARSRGSRTSRSGGGPGCAPPTWPASAILDSVRGLARAGEQGSRHRSSASSGWNDQGGKQ